MTNAPIDQQSSQDSEPSGASNTAMHQEALAHLRALVGNQWSQLHSLRDKLGIERDTPLFSFLDPQGRRVFRLDDPENARVLEFQVDRDASSGKLTVQAFDARTWDKSARPEFSTGLSGGGERAGEAMGGRGGQYTPADGYQSKPHENADGTLSNNLSLATGSYRNSAFQATERKIEIDTDGSGVAHERTIRVGDVEAGGFFGIQSEEGKPAKVGLSFEGSFNAGSSEYKISSFDKIQADKDGLTQSSAGLKGEILVGAGIKAEASSGDEGFQAGLRASAGGGGGIGFEAALDRPVARYENKASSTPVDNQPAHGTNGPQPSTGPAPLPAADFDSRRHGAVLSDNAYGSTSEDFRPPPGFSVVSEVSPVNDAASGFQAVAYRHDTTGQIWVAFRGTDDAKDAAADLQLGAKQYVGGVPGPDVFQRQVDLAHEFTSKLQSQFPDQDLRLTGHSLGGGLAQIEAARSNLAAETFNAPGVKSYLESQYPEASHASRIVNHMRDSDVVSKHDDHIGQVNVYEDYTGRGFHDGKGHTYSDSEIFGTPAESAYLGMERGWQSGEGLIDSVAGAVKGLGSGLTSGLLRQPGAGEPPQSMEESAAQTAAHLYNQHGSGNFAFDIVDGTLTSTGGTATPPPAAGATPAGAAATQPGAAGGGGAAGTVSDAQARATEAEQQAQQSQQGSEQAADSSGQARERATQESSASAQAREQAAQAAGEAGDATEQAQVGARDAGTAAGAAGQARTTAADANQQSDADRRVADQAAQGAGGAATQADDAAGTAAAAQQGAASASTHAEQQHGMASEQASQAATEQATAGQSESAAQQASGAAAQAGAESETSRGEAAQQETEATRAQTEADAARTTAGQAEQTAATASGGTALASQEAAARQATAAEGAGAAGQTAREAEQHGQASAEAQRRTEQSAESTQAAAEAAGAQRERAAQAARHAEAQAQLAADGAGQAENERESAQEASQQSQAALDLATARQAEQASVMAAVQSCEAQALGHRDDCEHSQDAAEAARQRSEERDRHAEQCRAEAAAQCQQAEAHARETGMLLQRVQETHTRTGEIRAEVQRLREETLSLREAAAQLAGEARDIQGEVDELARRAEDANHGARSGAQMAASAAVRASGFV